MTRVEPLSTLPDELLGVVRTPGDRRALDVLLASSTAQVEERGHRLRAALKTVEAAQLRTGILWSRAN